LIRWRLDAVGALRWRRWDGEAVVFHEPTASTHRLGSDTTTVFELLVEAGVDGLDEPALMAAVGASADDTELQRHLRDILDSLQTSGLAECRAS
jgi:PqqD family protein of HPr-rel-A system